MSKQPTVSLGKLADIDRGVSWASSQETREPRPDSVPVLRIGNIQQRIDLSDLLFLNGVSEKQKRENTASRGSVMMVGSNGNHDRIGNCCRIDDEANYLFASFLVGLVPHREEVEPGYLFHVLRSRAVQDVISASVTGSTGLANLSLSFLKGLEVFRPRSADQQAIALFFDSFDRAIEQTEALLAKQQRIKTGLMHDLLTRGLDAQGHLRDLSTHGFKTSPIGDIPADWECPQVTDCLLRIEQGWSPNCISESAGANEWGVLKTTAVVWEGYAENENKTLPGRLSPKAWLEIMPKDVLMTRAGPNSRVGVVAYVAETRPRLLLSDKIYRLILKADFVPEFLALALSAERYQRQLSQRKTGMAESQTNISQEIVLELRIQKPTRSEQEAIVNQINTLQRVVDQTKTSIAKLRRLKTGLMHDLLTGRVSVTPLLAEASSGNH